MLHYGGVALVLYHGGVLEFAAAPRRVAISVKKLPRICVLKQAYLSSQHSYIASQSINPSSFPTSIQICMDIEIRV